MKVLTKADARLPYTTREVAEGIGEVRLVYGDSEAPVMQVTTNAAQKALKRLRAKGKVVKTEEGRWMATEEQYRLFKSGAGADDDPHPW
jgi:hypothetical protein